VSRVPGPRLLVELSSDAATCSSTPNLASLPRWAPALPRVPRFRALPPREESSDAATCSSALDLTYLPRWAPTLSLGLNLASLRGEPRCCHVPYAPLRAVDHRNKERHSCPGTHLVSHVSKAWVRVTEAPARRADVPLQFGSTVQRMPS
jgi:hypothetical protein